MQFVIPAKNLRIFSKIIQCLTKIGDELFLDIKEDKVVLKDFFFLQL